MIKKRYKLFTILFILLAFIILSSCGDKVNSSEKVDENATEKQKYVVELNMDNYKKYIDQRYETVVDDYRVYFYGSLSYAFYDNVEIEIEQKYYSQTTSFTCELSAGGFGLFYIRTNYYSYTIINVTGKVIYWI